MPLPRLNDEPLGNIEAELEQQRMRDARASARDARRRRRERGSVLSDPGVLASAGLLPEQVAPADVKGGTK